MLLPHYNSGMIVLDHAMAPFKLIRRLRQFMAQKTQLVIYTDFFFSLTTGPIRVKQLSSCAAWSRGAARVTRVAQHTYHLLQILYYWV